MADLGPLLERLAARAAAPVVWNGWHIARVTGGLNGILYRATRDGTDLAVKFTARDARDRAGREFAALSVLSQRGLRIAPEPVLFEPRRYAQPVVVLTWLPGESSAALPRDDGEWECLLQHLATIHGVCPVQQATPLQRAVSALTRGRVRPEWLTQGPGRDPLGPRLARRVSGLYGIRAAGTGVSVQPAVLTFTRARQGIQWLQWELGRVPRAARPADLRDLMEALRRKRWPDWPTPRLTLCRVDPNILNFVRRPGGWASVDWENSGWGDPAFELGDLMTHPAYAAVPSAVWERVVQRYCALHNDPSMPVRIRTYYGFMLARWAIFFARARHELSVGDRTQRLVARPADWTERVPREYARYLELANRACASD